MNSARLCSMVGRYDNPIPPRFLAPIVSLNSSSVHFEVERCGYRPAAEIEARGFRSAAKIVASGLGLLLN
jgi:hypothetical protein